MARSIGRGIAMVLTAVLAVCSLTSGTALAARSRWTPLEASLPFELEAEAALLMEAESGQVLWQLHPDAARQVASINKVMSLILLLEAVEEGRLDPEAQVVVSQAAASVEGSEALLDAGASYAVSDLLRSVIVASANDATIALAEALYGSESAFVDVMNRRAQELGILNTVFVNCTGLPAPDQVSTAQDVAEMSRELLKHPMFFESSKVWMNTLTHKSGRKTELVNTNRLIRFYEGADGVKTGSTKDAGYCLSASATRGGVRYIAVVLGAKRANERFTIAQKMLDYAFDHYQVTPMVKAGDLLKEGVIVKGRGRVNIVASGDLSALTRKDAPESPSLALEMPEVLEMPLEPGQAVGELKILLSGEQIGGTGAVIQGELGGGGLADDLIKVLRGWMFR